MGHRWPGLYVRTLLIAAFVTVANVVVVFVTAAAVAGPTTWKAGDTLLERFSQYREYAADRAAAATTGDPGALATALERLSGRSVSESDLRSVDAQLRGLYLLPWSADGLTRDGGPTIRDAYKRRGDRKTYFDADDLVDALVDSHPPTDERIERLRAMERSLETAG